MEIKEWNQQLAEKLLKTKSIDPAVVKHYLNYCNEKNYNLGQVLVRSNRISMNKLRTVLATPLPKNKGEDDSELAQLVKDDKKQEELCLDGKTFGEYEVISEIARGGMGIVYRAKQANMNRIVALKILLKTNTKEVISIKRFMREAKLTASLQHPNIIPIYAVGEQDGYNYFTMKYIEGCTFQDIVDNPNIPLNEKLAIFVRICDAIQCAHDHKIIHRDLKPSNILLDSDNTPYVTDFGLAKFIDSATMLTQSGTALGTPAYMSPEQAKGIRNIDYRSDIYSLGVILFQILSNGTLPFQAATLNDLYYKIIETVAPSPKQFNHDAPKVLVDICMIALNKNPKYRYKTAHALMNKIQSYLKNEKVILPKVPLKSKLANLWLQYRPTFLSKYWIQNNKIACLAYCLIFGLCIGIGVVGYIKFFPKEKIFIDFPKIEVELENHDYESALIEANNERLKLELIKDSDEDRKKQLGELNLLFARIYYGLGNNEESKTFLEKIKDSSRDYNRHKLLSLIYEDYGNLGEALKELKKYIKLLSSEVDTVFKEIVTLEQEIVTLEQEIAEQEKQKITEPKKQEIAEREKQKKQENIKTNTRLIKRYKKELAELVEQYNRVISFYPNVEQQKQREKFNNDSIELQNKIKNNFLVKIYNVLDKEIKAQNVTPKTLEEVEENLTLYPFYIELHQKVSQVYSRQGEYRKALEHIAYVLAAGEKEVEITESDRLLIIECFIEEKNFKEASIQCDKLQDKKLSKEENKQYKKFLVTIAMHNKDYNKAYNLYKELYSLLKDTENTERNDAIINMIRCCYYIKDCTNLQNDYSTYKVILDELSPQLKGEVNYYYALSLDETRKNTNKEKNEKIIKQQIALLKTIQEECPFYNKGQLKLGKIYYRFRQYKNTIKYLSQYLSDEKINNNLDIYDTLSRAYMSTEDYKKATEAWSQCIRIAPWKYEYYYYRAKANSELVRKYPKEQRSYFDKVERDVYTCMKIDNCNLEPLLILLQSIIDTQYYYKVLLFAMNMKEFKYLFDSSSISLNEQEESELHKYITSITTNEQETQWKEDSEEDQKIRQEVERTLHYYPYMSKVSAQNAAHYLKKYCLNNDLYDMIQEKINQSSNPIRIKNILANLKEEIEKEYFESQKGYFCSLLFRYYISKDESARIILDTNRHIVPFLQYFIKQNNESLRLRFFAMRMLWDLQRGDTIRWIVQNRNEKENQIDLLAHCILSQSILSKSFSSQVKTDTKKSIYYNIYSILKEDEIEQDSLKKEDDKKNDIGYNAISNIIDKLRQNINQFWERIHNHIKEMDNESRILLAQYTSNIAILNDLIEDKNVSVKLTAAARLKFLNEDNLKAWNVLEQYLFDNNELYQLYCLSALWSWEQHIPDDAKTAEMPERYKNFYEVVLKKLEKGNIKNISLERILLYILRYFPREEVVTTALTNYLEKVRQDSKWNSSKNVLAFQVAESLGYQAKYLLLKNILMGAAIDKNKKKKSSNNDIIKNINKNQKLSNKDLMLKFGALIGVYNANENNVMDWKDKEKDAIDVLRAFLEDDIRLRLIFSFCIGKMPNIDATTYYLLFRNLFNKKSLDKEHLNYVSILLTVYASDKIEFLKLLDRMKLDCWNDSSSTVRFLIAASYIHIMAQPDYLEEEIKRKIAKHNNRQYDSTNRIYEEESEESQKKFAEIMKKTDSMTKEGAAHAYERIVLSSCYESDAKYLYDLDTVNFRLSYSLYENLQWWISSKQYEKTNNEDLLKREDEKNHIFFTGHYNMPIIRKKQTQVWTVEMMGNFIDHAVQLNAGISKKSQTPFYDLLQIVYNYVTWYESKYGANKNEKDMEILENLLQRLNKLKTSYTLTQEDPVYDFWMSLIKHDEYQITQDKNYYNVAIEHIDKFLSKYPWQLEANLEKMSLLELYNMSIEKMIQEKCDEIEKLEKEIEDKSKEKEEKNQLEELSKKLENFRQEKQEQEKQLKQFQLKSNEVKKQVKFYQDRAKLIQEVRLTY